MGQSHSNTAFMARKTKRNRVVVQSVEALDRQQLDRIEQQLDGLDLDAMDLDDDDERDGLIVKLEDVNRKLIDKLRRLEQVVTETVDKAYTASKRGVASHREWDQDGDDDLRGKNRQLKGLQGQINRDKKKIQQLKARIDNISGADKLVNAMNELKHATRVRDEL